MDAFFHQHIRGPAHAPHATERAGPFPSPFADILCAVDGSRGSAETGRQAVALCGPATDLGFVAVSHAVRTGLSAQADLGEAHARKSLDEAARRARKAEILATA